MILANGKRFENDQLSSILETLEEKCIETLQQPPIAIEIVLNACEKMMLKLKEPYYQAKLHHLKQQFQWTEEQMVQAIESFTKDSLRKKIAIEIPPIEPMLGNIHRKRVPLGILFHIAAGNVEGLPVYSVLEGLLTGNINLLKLPSADQGFTIEIVEEILKEEPRLTDYLYVFDVPSSDRKTLQFLADLADGVVVWGGDEAVRAARQFASPATQIFAWGHKLSFAYATSQATDEDLISLAKHICQTNQLLCSSCQGIYFDSEKEEERIAFAKRFYEILHQVNQNFAPIPYAIQAKRAVERYTEQLEKKQDPALFSDGQVVVNSLNDRELTVSSLFRTVWIKSLPKNQIISQLKKMKGYLQTVGICCAKEEWDALASIFARTGLVRIVQAGNMSRMVTGEMHDGVSPLQLYSKIVEIG